MSGYKIVIADDHEMFREGFIGLVNKIRDLKVVGQARDGRSLLNILRTTQCDIVVIDLSMPNMDGMEALKKINVEYPQTKVLVLTMQKDYEHFKCAMAGGAKGYLLKEDAFGEFAKAVKSIMKDKLYVSPSISLLLTNRFVRSMDNKETPSLDILTKREQQVLKLVASGFLNKNIASRLNISIRTVETHRNNLTNKLGIKNTAGLVKYAISKGLI
ncbi:MAG: response regulator transcription factor [Candidatus Omnitrophica bacterium]|nr:response regulator transcription factor [Candidatus Omnitrophota bacterium]